MFGVAFADAVGPGLVFARLVGFVRSCLVLFSSVLFRWDVARPCFDGVLWRSPDLGGWAMHCLREAIVVWLNLVRQRVA